jgi:outer membrane protein assembly factor BamE
MDIDQGNRIDQETLAKLEPGMTRKQVEFLLGKAAINDSFHANQAHYIYYLYNGEEQQTEQKTMVLTYDDQEILQRIEGGL